jgi:hypothetical protein
MRYLACLMMLCSCSGGPNYKFVPNDDYKYSEHAIIRDAGLITSPADAAAIAEIVAKGIYGSDAIEKQKPLIVSQKASIWYIRGSTSKPKMGKAMVLGGNVEVEISKSDGRIIRVSHSK